MALIALLAILAGSCKKEVLNLGSDILPAGDFVSIKSIDTLSSFSYTLYNDSARTDSPTISYLGQDIDPYFGTTTAGFVSQIRLSNKWDGLPFTVDSMKLELHLLTTKKGSSDVIHYLDMYEISDQIYVDTAYYSNTPLNLTGYKIEGVELPLNLRTDSINDIELNLPNNGVDFGNYLIRDTLKLFYNNNVPDFRSYFRGLYFRLRSDTDPMLLSLSLIYDQTTYYNYFVMYGHDDSGVSKQYSFILDSKNANASYNIFTHDFSTATLGDKMAHRNTTYKDSLSFLQSLNGVYTKIVMPGLENVKNDPAYAHIAVNKARLVIPVSYDPTVTGVPVSKALPSSLRIRYEAKTGLKYDVPDFTMASSVDVSHSFFDGRLDTVALVYNFNIPAYIQAYLKDTENNIKPEVEIYEPAGTQNVIFKANNNKTPVKLEFTYSEF